MDELDKEEEEEEEESPSEEIGDDDILENALEIKSENSSWDDSFEEDVEKDIEKFLESKSGNFALTAFQNSTNKRETLFVEKLKKSREKNFKKKNEEKGEKIKKSITNKEKLEEIKKKLAEGLKKKFINFNNTVLEKDLEEGEIDDTLAYWKTKDTEFKKFFLFGLKDIKTKSRFVMNLNLYFYTRLLLYDICFLTLYNIPPLQVLLPLAAEIIFLYAIFRVRFKYHLFTSNFIFFKFAFQSYSVVFWLFLTFCFSFSRDKSIYSPIGFIKISIPVYPFDDDLSKYAQYYALVLVFFAILAENVYLFYSIYCSVRNTVLDILKKRRKKEERRRLELASLLCDK